MNARVSVASLILGVMAITVPATACLWDTDTLQMERKRFPGTYELITGKFVRHSRAYYEWRVQDRLKKLEQTPGDPALIDDLAVAYDKLGLQADGIAVLESCLAEHPERYETVANLGTLYIHAGELDKGAELIAKAIEINPAAHFGREKYQLLLVKYVQQSALKSEGVLSMDSRWSKTNAVGFAKFILDEQRLRTSKTDKTDVDWQSQSDELDAALMGILGIVHFGNYESPVVLEVLGDLLLRTGEGREDARLLAARAYLKAASASTDSKVVVALEQMADDALQPNEDYNRKPREETVAAVAKELAQDISKAKKWFQDIADDEASLIKAGGDVDRSFAAKYYDSLENTIGDAATAAANETPHVRDERYWDRRGRRTLTYLAGIAFIVTIGCFGFYRVIRFLIVRRTARTGA